MTARYLPLLKAEGGWIDRPDLYVLARMSYEDGVGNQVVSQLYEMMKTADNSSPDLNILEGDLAKRQVGRNMRHRVLAGSVVLELVRLVATSKTTPSLAQAFRLVALNQGHHDKKRAHQESLLREVRKGFSDYRNTAHLQAASLIADPGEASEVGFLAFLARARAFELFLNTEMVSRKFSWEPWAVPNVISPAFDFRIRRLSAEEVAAAGGTMN
jgi:hypothetical protein